MGTVRYKCRSSLEPDGCRAIESQAVSLNKDAQKIGEGTGEVYKETQC